MLNNINNKTMNTEIKNIDGILYQEIDNGSQNNNGRCIDYI